MKSLKILASVATAAITSPLFATAYTLEPNSGVANGATLSVPGTIGGTALWTALVQGPSGTGNLQPFLRVQQAGNNTTELGYNSNNITPDAKEPLNFTHDVSLGSIATTVIGGTTYLSLYFDSQQSNSNPTFTFTTFTLGLGAASQSTTVPTFTTTLWSLGAGNTILYTDVNQGNGAADVQILVPVANYASLNKNSNLILYVGGSNANSSFEEFGSLATSTSVPDGGSALMMLGSGFVLLAASRRFFSRAN